MNPALIALRDGKLTILILHFATFWYGVSADAYCQSGYAWYENDY